jgi:hypothetical protein
MINQIQKTFPKMKMTNRTSAFITAILVLLITSSAALAAPSDQSDVRAAVQRIFNQLKNGEYSSLYDALPSSARSRTTRERLAQGLQRTQDTFELQKIEIGSVSVSGTLAVVDTTMYAHVKPLNADGKLVVQQYLVREDGSWRVATGDTATINRFLQSNPAFARRFPIRKPQAFVYQNNKWVPIPLGAKR